jgi:hypothetical protein
MFRRTLLSLAVPLAFAPLALAADAPAAPPQPKIAASRIVGVTVYPNNALVTREVEVPAGVGTVELVVNPLPVETVNSSLYSEASNGTRVLTTRYRMRPIKEDTREEVRKLEAQIRQLNATAAKIQSDQNVAQQNLAMLAKLEGFTGTTLKALTEKGLLNADAIIALSKYVMDSRSEKSQALVGLQQDWQDNREQLEFVGRKLRDLTAGTSKIERDAIIVVDKKEPGVSTVRLHYLVNSASWHPLYKLRAGKDKEKEKVQVEYLAAVVQQSGEEWSNVNVTLSTAEPMLNAAPPDLKILAVSVMPRAQLFANAPPGPPGAGGAGPVPQQPAQPNAKELNFEAQKLRKQSQEQFNFYKGEAGNTLLNSAAALEQQRDLLVANEELMREPRAASNEGPSVTYHLNNKLSIPSRKDEQVIEITRLDLAPEYYYKAVPVLTSHVYRLANLTNNSQCVLLPGEATMYIGSDFVGRAELPLVAIGEEFTAGFGVDPQLQVQRQLVDKTRTNQGDNQVWKYEYRILVSSYKAEPVKLQLWDRLPHADAESVGVTLQKAEPKLSTDAIYLRECRPQNLLRWDLDVAAARTGEKAVAINYEFKLELGKQMTIHSFSTSRADAGIPLPSMPSPVNPPAPAPPAPPRP